MRVGRAVAIRRVDPDGVADTAGAFRWFSAAAERGSAEGLNALAMMHEDGTVPGRAADLEEAKALYVRAADKGHAHAHNNLGYVYAAVGEHEEAARRFRAAADRGDADAMHNLGALHESGVGVRKDAREARRLYANAAERGHAKAAEAFARLEAREDVGGDGVGDGASDVASASAASASLRRQLAAKEKETSRLAKELGESKAECGRLKSTWRSQRGDSRTREGGGAPASGAPRLRRRRGAGRIARPAYAQHEPHQQQIQSSNYSGLSGCRAVRGRAPSRRRRRTRRRTRRRRPAPRGPSRRHQPAGGGPALSSCSQTHDGRAKRAEKRAAEKESLKAHNREVSSVRRELEAATSRAELHEAMSATLSEVLRATYARNLQLEELLRKVGVDPDDPAIECELTPIAVETVAGYDVSQLDAGREGVGPGGELGPGARGARHENGAADAPTGEGDAVAALPSPGSGNAR